MSENIKTYSARNESNYNIYNNQNYTIEQKK